MCTFRGSTFPSLVRGIFLVHNHGVFCNTVDRPGWEMTGKIPAWWEKSLRGREWENGRKISGMVGKKRKERTGIIKPAMRCFLYSQTFLTFYVYSNGLWIRFVVIHPRAGSPCSNPHWSIFFKDKVCPLEWGYDRNFFGIIGKFRPWE
jgi:hypothetical protein